MGGFENTCTFVQSPHFLPFTCHDFFKVDLNCKYCCRLFLSLLCVYVHTQNQSSSLCGCTNVSSILPTKKISFTGHIYKYWAFLSRSSETIKWIKWPSVVIRVLLSFKQHYIKQHQSLSVHILCVCEFILY